MGDETALVAAWSEAGAQGVLKLAPPEAVAPEAVWAEVYHSLIHSHSLSETLLRLEHSHAEAIEAQSQARDEALAALARDHAQPGQPGAADGEAGPSLATRHLEERQMLGLRWDSDLGHARETQRREFRQWVMCVHGQRPGQAGPPGVASLPASPSSAAFALASVAAGPSLQESFTITLGAQMKHMHNLRLVASDPLDLCRYPASSQDALPQRLQTAMSLYSHHLAGLVLLSDDRLSTFSGITRPVAELVARSTEYHFPTFERQLQALQEEPVGQVRDWRAQRPRDAVEPEPPAESGGLQRGDCYITRHSNLCGVHVLFHLVTDPPALLSSAINSRHPAVLGLRHILKTASLSDVTTLSLPLLLAHDMAEAMTVPWCLKRAELVFKCVKGFMMEVASWGGSELKTIQFLVPQGIDPEVFARLTAMLSDIFRTSNPIRGN
eukprot:snap_masked-scaffold476_size161517-processed-gene-0.30 protein:Tk11960 transcript:snap_masked-scaffold476_size161517-processed-gene-0.30-mRNA-1 annotation:"PREDICTED: uncharacterized protein C12orf4 homolog"